MVQVCSTSNDCLLVKFRSISQARSLNQFKKNLPKESCTDDFVPPCLHELEGVLTSYGNKLRASRQQGQPPVRTRRVWLKGTRVLQVKYGFDTYRNILGFEGLGRQTNNAEMNMLLSSFYDVDRVDGVPPTDELVATTE